MEILHLKEPIPRIPGPVRLARHQVAVAPESLEDIACNRPQTIPVSDESRRSPDPSVESPGYRDRDIRRERHGDLKPHQSLFCFPNSPVEIVSTWQAVVSAWF